MNAGDAVSRGPITVASVLHRPGVGAIETLVADLRDHRAIEGFLAGEHGRHHGGEKNRLEGHRFQLVERLVTGGRQRRYFARR
jgi:hypothetical protein